MLEGKCRCGQVCYRIDPPHQFARHPVSPMVHLVGAPKILSGEALLTGEDWQLCSQCGTTMLYQGKALCSTLERPDLLPGCLHTVSGAWSSSSQETAKVLEFIQRGVPIEGEIDGETPLSLAARRNLNVSRVLLEHGARVERAIASVPGQGESAPEWQRLLLKYGCEAQSLLYEVASRATVAAAEVVLAAGVDVNLPDEDGWLPLYCACGNSAAMVKLLISHGAETRLCNGDGLHPLHYCASLGHKARLMLLLKAGVDANFLDSAQESALLLACYSGHTECAKLLLKYGADVNLGAGQFTPLMGASRHGSLRLVNLLLEHGADPKIRNEKGETARDIALRFLPDLEKKLTQGKDRVQLRWSTSRAGERRLKLSYQGKTAVWTNEHKAIVERLA